MHSLSLSPLEVQVSSQHNDPVEDKDRIYCSLDELNLEQIPEPQETKAKDLVYEVIDDISTTESTENPINVNESSFNNPDELETSAMNEQIAAYDNITGLGPSISTDNSTSVSDSLLNKSIESKVSLQSSYSCWLYKRDFKQISQAEADNIENKILRVFLQKARKGELMINVCNESKEADLKAGKLKLALESPKACEFIKELLVDDLTWVLLAPEELSTEAGQAFWVICPPSLKDFVSNNTFCELILIQDHTGFFLDDSDVTEFLPPKVIMEDSYIYYLFLSFKAQKYFEFFGWVIAFTGCTLNLTRFDQATLGTTPSIKMDVATP